YTRGDSVRLTGRWKFQEIKKRKMPLNRPWIRNINWTKLNENCICSVYPVKRGPGFIILFLIFGLFFLSEVAPIRLVNGSTRCAGRVEVLHNQQWGTVCDGSCDLHDAEVVCRQLGCGMAISAPGEAWFGQGSDPIWLDEVHCTGMEDALSECKARPWGDHNCNHGEDA
ncbi:hypothetical protein KIL84_002067, partial [Mauremys mutica]